MNNTNSTTVCEECISNKNLLDSINKKQEMLMLYCSQLMAEKNDLLANKICNSCSSVLDVMLNQSLDLVDCDKMESLNNNNEYDDLIEIFENEINVEPFKLEDVKKDILDATTENNDNFFFNSRDQNMDIDFDECVLDLDDLPDKSENKLEDESESDFEGFLNQEIKKTNDRLKVYKQAGIAAKAELTATIKLSEQPPPINLNPIKSDYSCQNKLGIKWDHFPFKISIKDIEASYLNNDYHYLCKLRLHSLLRSIDKLLATIEEIKAINNSWQYAFLAKNGHTFPTTSTAPNPAQGAQKENPNRKLKPHEVGYRADGQVYMGHLTWVNERDFDEIFYETTDPSRFLNKMAILIFGYEVLATSSITGTTRKGVKKPQLNSIRLDALKNVLKYFMKSNNMPQKDQQYLLKNFNKILGRKILLLSAGYRKTQQQTRRPNH